MTVYVDPLMPCITSRRWPWGEACHLFSPDWAELHAFAARLGLVHSWFQNRRGKLPHYDLTAAKRQQALAMGAVALTDGEEIIAAYARCGDRVAQSMVARRAAKAVQA